MSPKRILALTGVGCLLASALVAIVGVAFFRRAYEPFEECEFAERVLIPGLLSEPVALERGATGHRGDVNPFFVTWFDGRKVLLRVDGTHGTALDEEFQALGEVELPGFPAQVQSFELGGETSFAVLHGAQGQDVTGDLSIVTNGQVRAIHRSEDVGQEFEYFAVLQREAYDPLLVALPTEGSGIYAFKTNGDAAWELPRQKVGSHISTHPNAPGLFLPVGMNAILFKARGTQAPEKVFARQTGFYVQGGQLCCTAGGAPRVLVVGLSPFGHETLQALDRHGKELWEARLPFDVSFVARIEPEGKMPAVAALGRFGELVVFDLENRLLAETRLPDAGDYTYALESGPFESGAWGIIATSLNDHFLYRVDVSLLPTASNAAQEK